MLENDRDDHVSVSKNLCEKRKTEKEHKKRMRAAQARRRNAELQEVRDGLGVMDVFWINIPLSPPTTPRQSLSRNFATFVADFGLNLKT